MNSESSIRRALSKQGMILKKNRANSISREWYGVGYMVIDADRNTVVIGATHREYDASLNDVSEFLKAA